MSPPYCYAESPVSREHVFSASQPLCGLQFPSLPLLSTTRLIPAGICCFLLYFPFPTLLLGFLTFFPDSEITAFPHPLDLPGTDQVLNNVCVKACIWSEGSVLLIRCARGRWNLSLGLKEWIFDVCLR